MEAKQPFPRHQKITFSLQEKKSYSYLQRLITRKSAQSIHNKLARNTFTDGLKKKTPDTLKQKI